jgi:hypothetical protein
VTTNKHSPEVHAIIVECMRRAKMADEQELEARLRGEPEYSAYLLGMVHAYTSAYYQISSNSFTHPEERHDEPR